ncbi:MAG: VOC family protein [Trueperaceae bacterium]|nr:VOC family protein [Trueperaceae bacterium]
MSEAEQFIAFYPSKDLEATRAFYEGILGLKLARDQGSCLIFQVTETAYIGFCQHLSMPASASFIITLIHPDVDAVYASLRAKNCRLESAPELNERYQIYHFFALDPNAYRVEIQRFIEPL